METPEIAPYNHDDDEQQLEALEYIHTNQAILDEDFERNDQYLDMIMADDEVRHRLYKVEEEYREKYRESPNDFGQSMYSYMGDHYNGPGRDEVQKVFDDRVLLTSRTADLNFKRYTYIMSDAKSVLDLLDSSRISNILDGKTILAGVSRDEVKFRYESLQDIFLHGIGSSITPKVFDRILADIAEHRRFFEAQALVDYPTDQRSHQAKSELHDVTQSDDLYYQASQLNAKYRTNFRQPTFEDQMGWLPMYEWATVLDEDSLDTLEWQLKSIDVQRELERIDIQGLEQIPHVLTPEQLSVFLRTYIPPVAFEGVSRIVFAYKADRMSESDREEEAKSGLNILAHHDHAHDENQAEVVIWLDNIDKSLEDKMSLKTPMPFEQAAEYVRGEVYATIAHEFGHALSTVLPVSLLAKWDEAVDRESEVYVSDYVKHRFEDNHPHRYTEDFADTFRLFVNHPRELRRDFTDRYDAMRMIMGYVMPGVERTDKSA